MDKRIIAGLIIIVIGIGLGYYVFIFNKTPNTPGVSPTPSSPSPSPKSRLSGTVTDESGQPISGVTITINNVTSITNQDGKYSVTLSPGSYEVIAEKTGYQLSSSNLNTTDSNSYDIDFSLVTLSTGGNTVLNIITQQEPVILLKTRDGFLASDLAKQYGITNKSQIRFLNVSASLWNDTIKTSGDIDIVWGTESDIFDALYKDNLLSPFTGNELLNVLSEIPDEIGGVSAKRIFDGKVYWAGSSVSSYGFTVNNNFLGRIDVPEPVKWIDLVNETYAVTLPSVSCIGIVDATLSTSSTRIFEIILQLYGWEQGWKILTLMGGNAQIFNSSKGVLDAVVNGNIGAGTTIDYEGYNAQLENPVYCKYILPENGTLVNIEPIALVTTSKNPEVAQAFISWQLSPEGQGIWLDSSINRLPSNPQVFNTTAGKTRNDLKEMYQKTKEALSINFSMPDAMGIESVMMYFYHGSIVLAHTKLVNTWTELIHAQETGLINHDGFLFLADELSNPFSLNFKDPEGGSQTFTVDYAKSINERIKSDTVFRKQLIETWTSAAEARYDTVLKEIKTSVLP